jgi:hypothetical protein
VARTNDELLTILAALESDQVERKETLKNHKDRVCEAR